jgi:hypothetical protein
LNIFKYTMITFTYIQINYKYITNFKYIQVRSNTFKYIKILWNIPWIHYEYIWNTLKYIEVYYKYIKIYHEYIINTWEIHLNVFKYTKLLSSILKYIEIYYKCIELHLNTLSIQWSKVQIHPNALKNIQILLCFFKYIYLPL